MTRYGLSVCGNAMSVIVGLAPGLPLPMRGASYLTGDYATDHATVDGGTTRLLTAEPAVLDGAGNGLPGRLPLRPAAAARDFPRRARAGGRQGRGRARDAALDTMRCRWSWSRRSMDMRAARAVPMRLTPAAGARLTAAGSGPVPLVPPDAGRTASHDHATRARSARSPPPRRRACRSRPRWRGACPPAVYCALILLASNDRGDA